jgi:sterol desaturase/sphingolipid hydroxylase (fatty acid hydroxylase superfamily)
MNIVWNSRWLEYLVVTPRYHQVHHSNAAAHYRANMGSLLTIWDRIFGTYLNPAEIKQPLSFGIGERVTGARLVLGF